MPNDTRRELLLGIDNMLSELIQAVRLERKAYDHTFNESDKLPGINKVPESHMTHTKSKNEKPFQSTVCKATQTLPQPATSHLFDLPKTNIKSNAKYPNVDLTPSGYISSKHIKNPVNKCCISSTSGCSTGCSTCCRKYSNYSPSNELLLHCKSDYSCSCYMHTSF
ncbi:unnamed protein product [Trichobilharzia regenti]|nr:unnamed protein product [Trichobilharzia regenti]